MCVNPFPFYGVSMSSSGHATNATIANMPYWGILPMAVTNYGGDFQMFNVDPYQGYQVGLTFNPIASMSWGTSGIYNTPITPQVNMAAAEAQAGQILADIYSREASQNINVATANIAQIKTRLEAKKNAEGTTEEEKKKIDELLAKLKEQEEKLNKLKESSGSVSPSDARKQSEEISKAINEIAKEAANLLNPSSASTSTSTSTGTSTSTSTSTSTDTSTSTGTTTTTGTTATTGTTTTSTEGAVDDFDTATQSWVEAMFDAMDGLGTDDGTLEAGLEDINKDNVMQRMLCWNKYKSGDHNESFMEMFMADADSGFLGFGMKSGQKVKYGKQIALALRQKADELGIYDECKADFAAINKEMNSWFYVDNDVAQNYDNIIKKIAAKMGSSYGEPTRA